MADPERAEMSASEIEKCWRDCVEIFDDGRVRSMAEYGLFLLATLAARDKRIEALEAALNSLELWALQREAVEREQYEAPSVLTNRIAALCAANAYKAMATEIRSALQPTPTEEADDGA